MALIFGLSSMSNPPSPPAGSDKLGHVLLYSGLGFLLARALVGRRLPAMTIGVAALTILLVTAYGLSDETHQLFVPNREFELGDLLADTIGATAGTVGLWAWGIIRDRIVEALFPGRAA